MKVILLKKNDNELEYKIDDNTYKFQKWEFDDENEYGDSVTEYQVILTFISGSETPRIYVKKYPDQKNERDAFFSNLKQIEITDFTTWESS